VNRIVQAWNNHLERSGSDAPDTVNVVGEKINLKEIEPMSALPKNHFQSVVRLILRSQPERVLVLRTATHEALKRLGAKRDTSKAWVKMPKGGSDQGDMMSIITWLKGVDKSDVEAVAQVVSLDATAVART
jgi:hypothetical protein